MKTHYFKLLIFTIITFYLAGCSQDENNRTKSLLSVNQTIKGKSKKITEMVGPNRHTYKWLPGQCFPTPHDCFPDVIVTAPRLIYVNELDSLIAINQVSVFFQTSGHYPNLFPGFDGPALYDLRNDSTTLRKGVFNDTTVIYHIVLYNDTTTEADYSQYY